MQEDLMHKDAFCLAYFDEPYPQIASHSIDPDDASSSNISLTSTSQKGKAHELSLFPLKRQISEIAINTENLPKK
ncbi:hypothetical protein LIER_27968 [Lithospermum erythrorhizon]|uniref:Uncharacterized protein n=1 Tax=Lithospermum erythrorhizon TaxID=34254 RepID=A0AAV3RJY6_LITER